MLLAFFVPDRSKAREVLNLCGVELDTLLTALQARKKVDEESGILESVLDTTRNLARRSKGDKISTLHLLTAICRNGKSLGYRLLQDINVDPGRVRSVAMRGIADARTQTNTKLKAIARDALSKAPEQPKITESSTRLVPPRADVEPPAPNVDASRTNPFNSLAYTETLNIKPEQFKPRTTHKETDGYDDHQARFVLDERLFPVLSNLGRNLSLMAAQGRLDPAIGRDREVNQLLDVLLKRRSNNPLLIGDPGVGKTAIVEGLARQLVKLEGGDVLEGTIIVEIPISSLDAGTHLRGAFTERMQGLMDEVDAAEGRVVIFFDEIHLLIGTGAGDGALDAGNVLKSALARGAFPCIGATTILEYVRTIERDPALARRFSTIEIAEPIPEDAIEMLQGILEKYATHHGVRYEDDISISAVNLSRRYIPDRALPDKAIGLIDEASSRVRRAGREEVCRKDLASVVSELTGIPLTKILVTDQERLLHMELHLSDHIVGHTEEIKRLCRVIRRNFAGFRSRRPVGSFLLLGPTGVGKTETARVLAKYFFQRSDALRRFDMSEYSDRTSVNKLIGSPAGYEGHDELPALTKAVWKHPHQVILFDEIEKSDPSLWPIFLQMLDEGTVEDRRGIKLDFRESIIIMTSNLGADCLLNQGRTIGFASRTDEIETIPTDPPPRDRNRDRNRERVVEAARRQLPPELWARFDERLVYLPLEQRDLRKIAELMVSAQSQVLELERNIQLRIDPDALSLLMHLTQEADLRDGARGLRRIVDEQLVDVITQYLLSNDEPEGTTLGIYVSDGTLAVEAIQNEITLDDTVIMKMPFTPAP